MPGRAPEKGMGPPQENKPLEGSSLSLTSPAGHFVQQRVRISCDRIKKNLDTKSKKVILESPKFPKESSIADACVHRGQHA